MRGRVGQHDVAFDQFLRQFLIDAGVTRPEPSAGSCRPSISSAVPEAEHGVGVGDDFGRLFFAPGGNELHLRGDELQLAPTAPASSPAGTTMRFGFFQPGVSFVGDGPS